MCEWQYVTKTSSHQAMRAPGASCLGALPPWLRTSLQRTQTWACLQAVVQHSCMYFLGRFSIKDVVPSKEGESSKVKVKVRLDIHGVLNVVNASLVEKLAVAPDPEEESMEVEGQDEKAKETTGDAASEVELLDLLRLPMRITFIAVWKTLCIVH